MKGSLNVELASPWKLLLSRCACRVYLWVCRGEKGGWKRTTKEIGTTNTEDVGLSMASGQEELVGSLKGEGVTWAVADSCPPDIHGSWTLLPFWALFVTKILQIMFCKSFEKKKNMLIWCRLFYWKVHLFSSNLRGNVSIFPGSWKYRVQLALFPLCLIVLCSLILYCMRWMVYSGGIHFITNDLACWHPFQSH